MKSLKSKFIAVASGWRLAGWFGLLLVVDQVSKGLAAAAGGGLVTLNTGVSWGLFSAADNMIWLGFAGLLFLTWIFYFFKLNRWAQVLLLAGATSNLLDRFFYGGVRDWLKVPFLDLTNNLADWFIFLAVVSLILEYLYGHNLRRS